MLYSIDSNSEITSIPHCRDYDRWRSHRKQPAAEVERSAPKGSGTRGEVAGAQSAMRQSCRRHLRGAVRSFLGGQ